jgi:hypothetical protein
MGKRGPKPGTRPSGRQKGTPNKITRSLKDAILMAAQEAGGGGEDGMLEYFKSQATNNPNAFMGLVGRIIPLSVGGDKDNPLNHAHTLEVKFIEAPKSEE